MVSITGSHQIKNIDLNLLLLFLKVYETGNLSKSSNFLALSQPGVSLALKRLRDHFDDPLFVRTPKGMEPTAFARAIFPSIKRSADSLQESLRFKLNFVADESDRVFKLSMSEFGQLLLLPHLLERLSTVAPRIKVLVSSISADIENELSDGLVDLALGISYPTKEHFFQQLLIESDYVGLVSKDHPEIGDEITRQQYEKVRHLTIRNQTSGFYWVNKNIESMGIFRNFAANLSNYTSVANILTKTNHFMTTPVKVANVLMRQGRLKKVKLPFELAPMTFMQHWHARQDIDPGSQWLRSLITSLKTDDVWADQ
jgi:DNA-binding transcriptional LysR family regulator